MQIYGLYQEFFFPSEVPVAMATKHSIPISVEDAGLNW